MIEAFIPLSNRLRRFRLLSPRQAVREERTAFAAERPLPGFPRPELAGFMRSVRNT